jgi:hypothetical protein
MTSTVFTSGTVIESPWLNDVNDYVYSTAAGTRWEWETTATLGQTVFNLPYAYTPGSKRLAVFISGIKQSATSSYVETNSTTVTFTEAVPNTAIVEFTY